MKVFGRISTLGLLILVTAGIALTATQMDPGGFSRIEKLAGDGAYVQPSAAANAGGGRRATYDCTLRVFMCEKVGRYNDSDGKPFDNNYLSFAFDTALSLAYQETYQETKIWSAAGFANPDFVNDTNMIAIAALYNAEVSGQGDSDPYAPQSLFDIHLVDACAAAENGKPGYDTATATSTHTVFIEDHATVW